MKVYLYVYYGTMTTFFIIFIIYCACCVVYRKIVLHVLSKKTISRNGSFAKIKDISIYYEIHGKQDGIPILLLHCFGFDGRIWKLLISHLKDTYKVIVIDIPGLGKK